MAENQPWRVCVRTAGCYAAATPSPEDDWGLGSKGRKKRKEGSAAHQLVVPGKTHEALASSAEEEAQPTGGGTLRCLYFVPFGCEICESLFYKLNKGLQRITT